MKKVVVITGSSRGLGREIALSFAKEKFKVVINYKEKKEKALQVINEINTFSKEVFSFKADVSNFIEVERMIKYIMGKWQRIDILINNAGIIKDALLLKIQQEDWEKVINTNLKGCFNCIKAISKIMIKQKEGHIINISSIVGLKGNIGQVNYSASKAGIIGLTKSSAKELGQYNIKVNVVLPGYLLTDLNKKLPLKLEKKIKDENVLGRINEAREVADFIKYLSFTKNISGQIFNLDSRII